MIEIIVFLGLLVLPAILIAMWARSRVCVPCIDSDGYPCLVPRGDVWRIPGMRRVTWEEIDALKLDLGLLKHP